MYLIPKCVEIEKRRSQKGISAYGLAMKAGLDKKAIYRIEAGDSKRTHNLRAQAIANALGCSVEDIFIIPIKGNKGA